MSANEVRRLAKFRGGAKPPPPPPPPSPTLLLVLGVICRAVAVLFVELDWVSEQWLSKLCELSMIFSISTFSSSSSSLSEEIRVMLVGAGSGGERDRERLERFGARDTVNAFTATNRD